MRRIALGHVAVDSAQLIVADPSYLNKWIRASDVEPYALNCLGRDVEAIIEGLQASDAVERVETMTSDRWFRVFPGPGHSALELNEIAGRIKRENGWVAATFPAVHDSYEHASQLTSAGGGGEILLTGTSGFAVVTGISGDGSYPVFLEIDDSGEPIRLVIDLAPGDHSTGS